MSDFSPTEPFERLKKAATDSIQDHFPIEGKRHTIVAKKIWVDDDKNIDDLRSQKDAKVKGRSWTVPVRAQLQIVDKNSGKVVDDKETTIAQLPKITRRYSYIVDGNEWQVNNQFRLKSGVYARRKENGELESQWNLEKGLGFRMNLEPQSRKLSLRYGSTNVGLYPVLKTLGVDDDSIERVIGKDLLEANRRSDKSNETELRKLHKKIVGKPASTMEEVQSQLRNTFQQTKLRADSTKITLGKPYSTVDGNALLSGLDKLLKVARQEVPQDDRDSLEFKDFYGTEDFLDERVRKDFRADIRKKVLNRLDKTTTPRVQKVMSPEIFGRPIKNLFSNSAIADRPTQMNPMNFIGGHRRTTLGGEHGLQGDNTLSLEAQSIHPSQLGFLDPIQTPESSRIGTILQMSSSSKKSGKEILTRAYNTKTKKLEWIDPTTAMRSTLSFPDQYKWEGGEPVALKHDVKVIDREGEMSTVPSSKVDYILRSSKGLFDVAANSIPFLQNNQGNRTMVAAKQLEQAVPLVHREKPLVQVKGEGKLTFENAIGEFNAHVTPVAGTVDRVTKDAIYIKGADGKTHEVQLYDDFPLNDNKSVLSSTPLVKKGDKVTEGQVVADTNFTKDGTLALGTNLRVAYMPYKGYNFEDGIVISDSAAKKLTSEHMLRHSVTAEENVVLNKNRYLAETAGQLSKEQASKLDEHGVIREGSVVNPGDVLIGTLRKVELTPEHTVLQRLDRKLFSNVEARPETWDNDYQGVVTRVVRHGKETTVYVKAQTPAQIGDKIVGRHGNKGIITKILPDFEMPQKSDGEHMEVLLNPTGIPTRINLGQALETVASKVAEKNGKPYLVNNFDPDVPDYTKKLAKETQESGVQDREALFDPTTGKKIADVLAGKQYILKLHHTAEKGISSRFRGAYDQNLSPKKGGTQSGQSMDANGLYALLAHGARENIREMQTVKSDKNDDYWTAVQLGRTPPAPAVPFVYKKFEGYLRGMGLDTKKDGNQIHLGPLTDKQTLSLSNGEIKRPDLALKHTTKSELVPEKGSIFDEEVTGTKNIVNALGDKWGHIKLPFKIPNPVFEKPIKSLLGITETKLAEVIEGKDTLNGKTGPEAVVEALEKIDAKKELEKVRESLPKLRGQRYDDAAKKARYLRALTSQDLSVADAYTMQHVPVIPPNMRPPAVMDNGTIKTDDVSDLYRQLGMVAVQAQKTKKDIEDGIIPAGEETVKDVKSSLYDGLKALTLTGMTYHNRHRRGIAELIGGGTDRSPKDAFFQDKVIGKRQDLSLRGVIVPEPSLGLDEVMIPEKAAREVYKPFVMRRMVQQGFTPGKALEDMRKNGPTSKRMLELEMENRPIFLKRDPVLHKYGIQAFKPKITKGKAIKIHPLATAGYNADFDGDKMAAFVPISGDAVNEAYRMLPSRNLFSPSNGQLMLVPSQESMLGLYQLSKFKKETQHKFKTPGDAAKAAADGKIDLTDVVTITHPDSQINEQDDPLRPTAIEKTKESAAPVRTTVGRLLLNQALPEPMRDRSFLTDRSYELTKDRLKKLLERVGKDHKSNDFARTADRLKDMGNMYSTGFSFGLDDLTSQNDHRDQVLQAARKQEKQIRDTTKNPETRKKKIVDLYSKANDLIQKQARENADKSGNRMYEWVRSGARGSWDQYRQMTVAPMLVVDSKGKTVPMPIDKSYSEGLDTGSYWASLYGARMGTIGRVKGTEEPGSMTKEMMQTSMNQMVVEDDCGTKRGQLMSVEDNNALNRFLAVDISLGKRGGKDKGVLPRGTLITPEILSRLKNNNVQNLTVRTPLKCEATDGVCAHCFGINESGNMPQKGTNLGVIAAHSLGEPLTQMAMNAFHCNHADAIVFVKNGWSAAHAMTMEDLFHLVDGEVAVDGDEEIKEVPEGIEVWDGRWVAVTHVRRHAPSRPMRVVGDGGLITICQDNHPIAVWRNTIACIACGYHRLKWPSPASRGQKPYCAKCGRSQDAQYEDFGDGPGFLPPAEIELKKFYLHRDLSPVVLDKKLAGAFDPPEFDGYVVGMFLAEGNVTFKRSHAKMREKKPYAIYFSQNEGPVRMKLHGLLNEAGMSPKPGKKGIVVNSLELGRRFHELFGRYNHNKGLPPDFVAYDREWLLKCLCGVIDGDGTLERSDATYVGIDTTSFEMAQQLVIIAAALTIHASITPTTVRELTRNQGYKVRLRLNEDSWKRLKEHSIKVASVEEKELSSAEIVHVTGHRLVSLNREILYTKKFVYDVTTESGTLYVSGLRHHNTGGVAGARGSNVQDQFERVKQLVQLPKTLPGSATLSNEDGQVQKVVKDKVTGGFDVFVNGHRHFVPADRGAPTVRVGQSIKKGEALSEGPKNPTEMVKLTGVGSVQRYLTDELEKAYGGDKMGSNIHRRNAEVFVRALTNLSVINDPGDHPEYMRGDRVPTTVLSSWNSSLPKGKKQVLFTPILKGTNVLPLENQTDWMARLQFQDLKRTIKDAASEGWYSDVHGTHPVPAMAYAKEFGKGTPERPWLY